MTQLPRALAPWAKQLAVFPDEIALALGGLVTRIAGVVGDCGEARAPTGEPDGFGGISRRGAYDRLLPTEWLLLEELPDEFIRRVIAGEHSFLERAYRRDSATRRTLVLFDAGPWQLGAPRVVQLATLVALGARAERLNATLVWGVLQDEHGSVREGLTRIDALELVRARSARVPRTDDVDNHLQGLDPATEIWLVGSPRLSEDARAHGAALVAIAESTEPGAPGRILVRAWPAAAGRAREAVLEMPPPQLAVRILRDPFATAVAARQTPSTEIDRRSNIVFGEDARRIHVRGANGTLITFGIPNSPRATVGPPGVFEPPPGHHVVGVGYARKRKRTVVLTRCKGAFVLHVLGKRNVGATKSHGFAMPANYEPSAAPHLQSVAVFRAEHACFVDEQLHLVELRDGNSYLRDQGCAPGARPNWQGLTYVSGRTQPAAILHATAGESPDSPPLTIAPSSEPFDARHWAHSPVVELPFATAAPVLHTAASHVSDHVAYLTASGELGVFSRYHGAIVLRVEAGVAE